MMRCERRGFSLVEMIVAIGMTGVIIGMLGVILQSVLLVSRRHNDRDAEVLILMRLDGQFRTDVHEADRVTLTLAGEQDESGSRLVLELPGERRIEYHYTEGRVHRTVTRQGATEHRDAFLVGDKSCASFSLNEAADGKQEVSLIVDRFATRSPEREEPNCTHRIVAVLSKS